MYGLGKIVARLNDLKVLIERGLPSDKRFPALSDDDLATLRPGISLICDNIFLLKQLVRDTDTVLIMSLSTVAGEVAGGELVRLPLEPTPWDDDPGRALAVAALPGRSLSPAANAIIAVLRETYRRASASLAELPRLAPTNGSADTAE